MLEAALAELEDTLTHTSPQYYPKVLLMVKRIVKILTERMPYNLD